MLPNYWKVYLFIIPSALLVAVFCYAPALSTIFHSLYRWNGDDVSRWIGDSNFRQLMGNYWAWLVVLVMSYLVLYLSSGPKGNLVRIAAGVYGMIAAIGVMAGKKLAFDPSIVKAQAATNVGVSIAIWGTCLAIAHFCVNEENPRRWIYKMLCLDFLAAGVLSGMAGFQYDFCWMIVCLFTGFFLWINPKAEDLPGIDSARTLQAFMSLGICFWALGRNCGGDPALWGGFTVITILVLANIPKMIPSIITAVVINRIKSEKWNYLYKVLFVVPMIIPGMVYLLLWKFFFDPSVGMFNKLLVYSKVMDVLVFLDGVMGWHGIFNNTTPPVWLGNEHLVLPAFIIWGFPWVGIVGVLIYLAGLEGIDSSVYEAAELDGAGSIQKFLRIELPLILTQVRINMVLMIIGTLQSYEQILILFGEDGGPNGVLNVPGLLMFKSAFSSGQAGYACAIALILFFFILLLTEINNRYIRVEK
jgi:raffinose/stachyose/melibiose transport system permease protein